MKNTESVPTVFPNDKLSKQYRKSKSSLPYLTWVEQQLLSEQQSRSPKEATKVLQKLRSRFEKVLQGNNWQLNTSKVFSEIDFFILETRKKYTLPEPVVVSSETDRRMVFEELLVKLEGCKQEELIKIIADYDVALKEAQATSTDAHFVQ